MQVLSIVTVAVAFVAMVGSIFGMNLYFNVQTTPPVCIIACAYVQSLMFCKCSKLAVTGTCIIFIVSWTWDKQRTP